MSVTADARHHGCASARERYSEFLAKRWSARVDRVRPTFRCSASRAATTSRYATPNDLPCAKAIRWITGATRS
jgi:hypothetical protein